MDVIVQSTKTLLPAAVETWGFSQKFHSGNVLIYVMSIFSTKHCYGDYLSIVGGRLKDTPVLSNCQDLYDFYEDQNS